MIGRLWLLACGQVRVRVTGASLTRFLNLCAAQGITLRQMDRTAWNELHATLSIRDFRTLRRHMGRTGCRVHRHAHQEAEHPSDTVENDAAAAEYHVLFA